MAQTRSGQPGLSGTGSIGSGRSGVRVARRALTVVAVVAAAAVAVAAPAAAVGNAPGAAHVGSVSYVKGTTTVVAAPVAPCSISGPTSGNSGTVTVNGVRFGSGTSTCTTTVTDPDSGTTSTKSEAVGKDFELSALVLLGGPRVKIANWRVTCTADEDGSTAGWSFGGLTGLATLPNPLPNNYVRELKNLLNVTIATITFNETTIPNDGSIGLTLAHIRLLPVSGMTGDVLVGNASCSPTP
ncbi:hypothetical protein [Actinokineospora inagensis]|uniref:hypothetical protein n=1 Tax=Actinokineospora inagensis TaxID=103730 RepID=UPI001FE1B771|nr:hypothetical protein [Actinokineospora inagensis]